MSNLRVIGVGLPRTGTSSLRIALEALLNGPCYGMRVLQDRLQDDLPRWMRALDGELDVIPGIIEGYCAVVGWPMSTFWHELVAMYPEALFVLSHRGDSATWWQSIDRTIFTSMRDERAMADPFLSRLRARTGFGPDWDDERAARAVYDRHLHRVRATIPAERLLVWRPEDGWEPLCHALGRPVPAGDFVHVNSTPEYRLASGLDPSR